MPGEKRGVAVYKALLTIIILVLLLTVGFAFLIWYQLGRFAEKALAAKRRQEEYIAELMEKNPSAVVRAETGWDDPDDDDRSGWI